MPTIPRCLLGAQQSQSRTLTLFWWVLGPSTLGLYLAPRAASLGRCPRRRKRPWLLGGWGRGLRNVPLLGSEVPESQKKQRTNRSGQQTCDCLARNSIGNTEFCNLCAQAPTRKSEQLATESAGAAFPEASTGAKPLSFPKEQGGSWRRGQRGPEGFLQSSLPTWPLSVVATGTTYQPNLCPGFIFLRGKASLITNISLHVAKHSPGVSQLRHRLGHKCQQQALHPPSNSFLQGELLPCENTLPFKMLGGRAGGRGSSSTYPPFHTRHREGAGRPEDLSARSCPLLPEAWKKELKDLASPGGHLHQGE